MSMVTSCPSCATTFRVTPPQLQAQHGQVRCGRCSTVFDGFSTLATLPDTSPDLSSTLATPSVEPPAPTPLPLPTPEVVEPMLPFEAPALATSASAAATFSEAPVAPKRRLGALLVLALLLLLGLAAQGAYLLRTEIATALPEIRPWMERLCASIGCVVGYPKRPELLAIEGSDLQVVDPGRPNQIVLTAMLRNRAPTVIAHPALELTLTNAQDQTIARRVFNPADYMPRNTDARLGMAPNSELAIRLELDIGDLRAAGYRLYLFYP